MYFLIDSNDNKIPFVDYQEAVNAMCMHNAMYENELWNIIEVHDEDPDA